MKESSTNVGSLFSRILSRHLEDVKIDVSKLEDSCGLTIEELTEWEIWPTMLKIYHSKSSCTDCYFWRKCYFCTT